MSELYPPIHENRHFYLKVDNDHEIYVEECGNQEGQAVIFLHGGPGAGCELYHRQLFDPEKYRIILFDQRGCGRSHPHASLKNNTTQDLISDMEKIREELHINKWVVAGGSWGSTLALLYAQSHPQRVSGLIVRGIFLATKAELKWFYQEGANNIFPDYWEEFIEPVAKEDRHDLLHAYHKILMNNNEIARMRAAKAWAIWEARTASLQPNSSILEHFNDPRNAHSIACIETHFFVNNCFIEENQILDNMDKIKDIPGYIIHGRYDMICPIKQAFDLHKRWPSSEFYVVNGAGHSAAEKGITAALIKASNELLKYLKQ